MPAMKDANIVKIAVEMTDQVAQLIEFNQKQPLAGIIQELCNGWNLTEPEQYALQFNENNNNNYITEKNRNEIKNGSVLRLQYSPSKTAQDILFKLNNGSPEEKAHAMNRLSILSADMTFALDFINIQGLTLIIKQIESGKCKGTLLAHTLLSFVELMEHGIVSWDVLNVEFISRVASLVNAPQEDQVTQAALSILENVVLNSTEGYGQVEREVPIGSLVGHLQAAPVVQQNAVALINALLSRADPAKRRTLAATLTSKQVRAVIQNNILQTGAAKGAEMAHQLYVLQTLMLGLLEQRMMTKMDPQEQDSHDKIKELRRIAFDSEGAGNIRCPGGFSRDYKKLGFKNDINPALDFTETPPGLLALDCMIYFARNHPESYTKLVLENSCRADEHECPFGRASVELVRILCEILKIGDAPSEQCVTYQPLFFTHDHPFEECFCICIVLLNKTWKEMRATSEDFQKVASVGQEQIVRALETTPASLEQLKNKLQTLTYCEITQLWQLERNTREEWESHAKPVVELREQITPDILQLIKQQRFAFLLEGTRFTKYSARGQRIKDKFWYMRLSPNHKVLHYGDCDEKSAPSTEELQSKLAVSDIKALLIGRDCPHMKGRKASHQLAFSLALEGLDLQSLDCVAPDELALAYWTDGINALMGQRMQSKETEKDLDTLLSMEIKLRLLDAEGVTIPQDPPPIPPDPPHYLFCYDLKYNSNFAQEGQVFLNKLTTTLNKMEIAANTSDKGTVESIETVDLEEEETFFQDIDLLMEYNISIDDINMIKKLGINTIKGVQMTIRKKLLELSGFNDEKVDRIKAACCKIAIGNAFMTALEVSDQRKQIFKLSTGSSKLNQLLGGGVESMSITEVFGEFRTGKTQLSHTLCVTAQMPGPNGYMGGKVMFIDTEHTFRPERLHPIAERFNLDQTAVLENILYARAYNSEHQFELLNSVAAKFHEEAGIFKLLIVDSIMALFRVDFTGRGEIADRQQKLGQMMSRLQKISEEYNVAVFVTNQITSDFSLLAPDGDLLKPIGGNILAHASTTRLSLKKGKGKKRIAKIYDSPDLEENEVTFVITNGGINDPLD